MKFLYWNLKNCNLEESIAKLSLSLDVDIIILSEVNLSKVKVLTELNQNEVQYYLQKGIVDEPLIFAKYSDRIVKNICDYQRISIKKIIPIIGEEILICIAHLPSKLHQNVDDQILLSTRISKYIEEKEIELGTRKTILVGDLNMNPFESGIVGAEGLHAIIDKNYVKKNHKRTVMDEEKYFFYNPMWKFFDLNNNGVYGTYYNNTAKQVNYFWNIFDQVLIRPELIDNFIEDELKIITEINGTSLLNKNGTPDQSIASDHLPIFFNIIL